MSQRTVHVIIGRLLTDEEMRLSFLKDPAGMLTGLLEQGFELTRTEIEALVETERALWSQTAARLDPRLQRSSLRTD